MNLQERLKSAVTPGQKAELRVELAGEYAWAADRLSEILVKKPNIWANLRKDFKSDTRTDRAWEETEDGRNEVYLRLRMKSIEKVLSALKTSLEIAEGEARNQY